MHHPSFRPARRVLTAALALPLVGLLSACGGGGDDMAAVPNVAPAADGSMAADAEARRGVQAVTAQALSDSQRIAAATATASSSSNACNTVRPFYWEIGSASARLASGSVKSTSSNVVYGANTPVALASASKWLYAAYVAQRRGGVVNAQDVKHLTMKSGYTNMYTVCNATQTVDACLAANGNGNYNASTDNRFYYGSGHMQKHASLLGLGGLAPKALGPEVQAKLGTDLLLGYSQPGVAIGAYATPDAYARFLRKLMNRQLQLGNLLGSNKVCTSSTACGSASAMVSPVSDAWSYSLGHWVEDTPGADGAFNSLGALGFYPWIDASRSYYGVLSRMADGGAETSKQCGQLIRKAWNSGTSY